MDLKNLTIKKTHEHFINGDFTALDLVKEYLKNIESKNKDLNAYLEVFNDVEEQAKLADEKIKSGKSTLLTGIPFAIKDNILIEGRIASSASKILENYHATYDATVIKKLKEQGVIFLGRTNMDEFAMGGSTENSAYGVTKNPHDTSRVAGGTSGGSAAAVASDLALVALGSDTGGSIRQPSSFCGTVGLKPTYGGVSRYGLMAAASSFDQIGPIAKTVSDVEIIWNELQGKDSMDSTTIDAKTYPKEVLKNKKPVVGIPRDFMNQGGIEKEILENFESTIQKLKSNGFEVVDISIPSIKYSLAAYYIIIFAEESSNLARFDGVKYGLHKEGKNLLEDYLITRGEGFGKEVRRRILLGTYVLSSGYYDAYYNKANIVRALIKNDFLEAFKKVDVILTPTTPSSAFKIGEKVTDPLQMYLEDIFTVTANLTGMPAISVPSGKTKDGLPLGIQFTANLGREDVLFNIGKDFYESK
ncbi:MAG: Asp-tRNA(Asn)/Glu-tRNA(Gln) amidotransferase subunit GatA [Candidatus Taylorbacteria bacterium]|nr:Asp-tRNA(Asn)/Glu-tRNA(Gln) amidotransferase subunit GatA [Candidatus Taylorbacteria bacterium]